MYYLISDVSPKIFYKKYSGIKGCKGLGHKHYYIGGGLTHPVD